MELKEEFMRIVEEVWSKLQGLPQASPLELGAFFILILFIGELFVRNGTLFELQKKRDKK